MFLCVTCQSLFILTFGARRAEAILRGVDLSNVNLGFVTRVSNSV